MDLTTIKFNKIEYIQCSDILKFAPIFSKKSGTTRMLIKNNNISDDMYIFAKLNDKNKWIKTDGSSRKYDKILLKKSYLSTIPELQKKKDNVSNVKNDVPKVIDNPIINNEVVEQVSNIINEVVEQVSNIININGIEYVDCTCVLEKAPIFSKGSHTTRKLVENKKISDDMFIFAKKDENGAWTESQTRSKRSDKILLKKDYLINIPELQEDNSNIIIVDENGVQKAPPIIELTDDEKFKDVEGKIMEIETRGVRNKNGLYLRLKDVIKVFGLKNLHTTLIHKESGYTINIHYFYFFREKYMEKQKKNNEEKIREKIKKEIYLSYAGILKVLFASNSDKVKPFQDWATNTLFTVQMGNVKQKQRLASNLLGVDANTVREVFNKSSTTVACIYLFYLGTVKDLRKIMNIDAKYPDNMCVYKWGKTNNLSRRTGEHLDTFACLQIDIKLTRYDYIDPQYITDAERDLKNIVKDLGFHFIFTPTKEQVGRDGKQMDQMTELAIMSKKNLEAVDNQYAMISKKYGGHITELVVKNRDLENTAKLLENTMKMNEMASTIKLNEALFQIEQLREQELMNKINILESGQKIKLS